MANNFDFNAPTAAPVQSNVSNFKGKNDALGFLNGYLPNEAGELNKLGAFAMKASNGDHAAIIAYLQEDPTRLEALMSQIVWTYVNTADAKSKRSPIKLPA